MSFVGFCSFMINVSFFVISNLKFIIDMFGRVFFGGFYLILKVWIRDFFFELKEFFSGDCMVVIDND